MKILIVEDEPNIASFEKLELEHEGYETQTAQTGREALAMFEQNQLLAPEEQFAVILLDIMLPELSGLEVLRRIRKISAVPVILVTARGETYDKVNGLDAGADDYIAKPFAVEELLARIRSILRRRQQECATAEDSATSEDGAQMRRKENSEFRFDRLLLNTTSLEVYMDSTLLTLTRTEFLLLKCLLVHRNEVLSRDMIIAEVWGEDHYIDENSVDVYVRYLRAKIDDVYGVTYITTVRGAGYTIRDMHHEAPKI